MELIMFVNSIDMTDVVLEGLKVIITLILIIILIKAGRRFPQLSGGGWRIVIFGFVLMFLGFLFDFSDEIINYKVDQIANEFESLIEEISLITGLILVTFGFKNWFSFIGRILGLKG